MFKSVYRKLEKEISGGISFSFVEGIIRFHRIQGSPGLRDAAKYVSKTLNDAGVVAEVVNYPGNNRDYAWTNLMFKEWNCNNAELTLVKPEENSKILARWIENKCSLIQKSGPTPEDGIIAEVILLENGNEVSHYDGIDVKGKIVLTNGSLPRVYKLAVVERGAIGIISDHMWIRPDIPEGTMDDAYKYTSFWWNPDDEPCFGFVLTPRRGRWLRQLLKESKTPVKLHAYVDSSIYEGSIDNAEAYIPGETDEEVIIIGHLCHPQPSANDNASGAAAAMEAMRVLKKYIDEGILPKPHRGIRMTLVPEMTGSYAFLDRNEERIPKMVAAVNMDMVGEKQEVTLGPLMIERTPESTPSYVNALMEAIFDEVKAEPVGSLFSSYRYPLFKHHVRDFHGGSDHYVYSDPTVNVPCVSINQWPDKFWHTSYDTIDKVDPEMLRKAALMTATYAYTIANAGPLEAIWLASETASRQKRRIISFIQNSISDAMEHADPSKALGKVSESLKLSVAYKSDRAIEAVKSVFRLASGPKLDETVSSIIDDLKRATGAELKLALDNIKVYAEECKIQMIISSTQKSENDETADNYIPHRLYRGPISLRPWVGKLSSEDQEEYYEFSKRYRGVEDYKNLSLYWTNGARSLSEISRLVEFESGSTNLEFLLEYYGWLKKMGLVEY